MYKRQFWIIMTKDPASVVCLKVFNRININGKDLQTLAKINGPYTDSMFITE